MPCPSPAISSCVLLNLILHRKSEERLRFPSAIIPLHESIGPSAGTLQGSVLENHRPIQHLFFFAVSLETVIGQRPNALFVPHFTGTLASSPTRTVPLILG